MAEIPDVVTLTQKLVSIPSESSNQTLTDKKTPEQGVADYLLGLCKDRGISFERQAALPGRHNAIIRFPKPNAGKLLIIAHMDTVSAQGMENPFTAGTSNGMIYGRGACDDKGPLAAAFSTLLTIHQEKIPLAYDVTFAATVDEECTMSGATKLAESMPDWDLCIALEPTNLRIIKAHKGVYRFRVFTHGQAAHSSVPEQGENAIHAMLPIIRDLQRYGNTIRATTDPEMGNSFLSFTQIQAGSSLNIIPDACSLGVDIRILPDVDPAEVAQKIQGIVGDRGTVEEDYRGSGIRSDLSEPLIAKFLKSNMAEGESAEAVTAPFATDCSKLAHKGPCIVWGPGDIAQAHNRIEYVAVKQLETACRILGKYLTAG